ncbi:hypothetical protein [Oryza sativa Japonica Group]|uniref:Uncharacterized protein n=2 Tax=Oryza sativa subsp. japonica TaxID=39947 RepID=Q5QLV1_ORYSJ|nr:hypothetical protein [Oryza sativa Japonica Group]BAD73613.1 hypothetical protein [Oryza sativa Japonica Group]
MVNLYRLSKCLVMKAWRSPDVADPHGLGDPGVRCLKNQQLTGSARPGWPFEKLLARVAV